MDKKKWVLIGLGAFALIAIIVVAVIIVRKNKDNEAGIIDWVSSKTV